MSPLAMGGNELSQNELQRVNVIENAIKDRITAQEASPEMPSPERTQAAAGHGGAN
jgi:hypothetical protein